MAGPVRIVLGVDSAALTTVLVAIQSEISGASPEGLAKVAELLFGGRDLGSELVNIEVNPDAAAAGEIVVRLQPADRLRMALAALRAGDVDGL